jgi:hypothetical protein
MVVKDLYNENYKTLKKEIEEDSRSLKDFPHSGVRNNVKWLYY